MTLNRSIAPPTLPIEEINVTEPAVLQLDNGIRCYMVGGGLQEVCRISMVFNAGTYYQSAPLVARFTNKMADEGSHNHNAYDIALTLEYYGAYFDSFINKDTAGFNLSLLNSKLESVLPVIEDIIKNPVFPNKELKTLANEEKKNFLDESLKVQSVAAQEFNELIFGPQHPYGKKAKIEDYDIVTSAQMADFHSRYYHAGNCFIIVSGKTPPRIGELLNRHFGGSDWVKTSAHPPFGDIPFPGETAQRSFREMPSAMQNAIRIGKRTVGLAHPDHAPLTVLNTILGGYFGSRLMKNIREDKGYTYGIYSVLTSYHQSGLFYIASEVGTDVHRDAIEQIYKEITRIQNEPVQEDELRLVKDYLTGSLLRMVDGPFAVAALAQSLIPFGLKINDFIRIAHETIRKISSYDILGLACKHLEISTFSEVIAGKK